MSIKLLSLQASGALGVTAMASITAPIIDFISLGPNSVTANSAFYTSVLMWLVIRAVVTRGRGWRATSAGTLTGFGLAFQLTDYTIQISGVPLAIAAGVWVFFGEQLLRLAQDAISSPEKAGKLISFLRGLIGGAK